MNKKLLSHLSENYIEAEITCVFLHEKKTDTCFNLLTLIELCPSEQEASSLIGDEKSYYLDRCNKNLKNHTVYMGRAIHVPIADALAVYEGSADGFLFKYEKVSRKIIPFANSLLTSEPPENQPLLLEKYASGNLSVLLPHRNTAFRLWCRIDKQKAWMEGFEEKELDSTLENATVLAQKHLQLDLFKFDEHLGNIYLFCCNPLIREKTFSLPDHDRRLLVQFKERQGHSVAGLRLLLEEKRGDQTGFSFWEEIKEAKQLVPLPYFPDQLHASLYHPDGYLLEKHLSKWVNFSFDMNIQEQEVRTTIHSVKGAKVIRSAKYSRHPGGKAGTYDFSGAHYFRDRQKLRSDREHAGQKDFHFFEGAAGDSERASAIIHELLSKASYRCMLLDPYFGAADIEYAIGVPNLSVVVQVISSANFLHGPVIKEEARTHGQALLDIAEQYRAVYSSQQLHFRVLGGNSRSPLHDRFIVVDDRAYLLGSSFNEFGSRATMLLKVPVPELLIDKAIHWWAHESVDLRAWVEQQNENHAG